MIEGISRFFKNIRNKPEVTSSQSNSSEEKPQQTAVASLKEMEDIIRTRREQGRHATFEEGVLLEDLAAHLINRRDTSSVEAQAVEDALNAMNIKDRRTRLVKKELDMTIGGAEHLRRGGKHGKLQPPQRSSS